MSRSYPRIGAAYKNKKWEALGPGKGPVCDACGAKALFRVDVEVGWFRGDDESRKACAQHKEDALALLAKATGSTP